MPASAALLARLAVTKMDGMDWSDAKAIGKLRIADFACGTGALLSAVYEQIAARHDRAGGDTAALHGVMMEEVLYGCDVMPSAVHITGSTLSGVEPAVLFNGSHLYAMPYGRMKDGTVAIGSLELLQSSDVLTLVANAGLLLPVTLAQHLGLREVVDSHVDLGDAPGRANPGDKLLTLVASALAGGDFIDDADVLRTGGTAGAIGCVVKAPSTLGTFLRSFRCGHVRQLDRVSRELLSRAWAAGAGPGEGPLTIDLDSTMCETYGLAKEGARHHGYTGQRGYHPLLAIAAGTGEVLMSRLREGRANTARGAAHFLRETVGRVRHAGARGQLTVRADSGFYAHALVVVCREMDVRFSITIRQHARLRELIEAIPEEDWTPVPYWMDGGADVAETTYTPFTGEPEAAPVRLIVRRVKPTPGSQLALFASYSYHGFITDRDGETLELEADHRRHAEIENAIRDLKHGVGLNHLPSGRFPANGAWLAVQVLAHNLARWTARIGLDEGVVTTRTLRRRFFSLAGRLTRSARRLTLHLPQGWPWETQFTRALARLRALPLPA